MTSADHPPPAYSRSWRAQPCASTAAVPRLPRQTVTRRTVAGATARSATPRSPNGTANRPLRLRHPGASSCRFILIYFYPERCTLPRARQTLNNSHPIDPVPASSWPRAR